MHTRVVIPTGTGYPVGVPGYPVTGSLSLEACYCYQIPTARSFKFYAYTKRSRTRSDDSHHWH
eukprot:3355318-Rhodomonas_salina.1